MMRPRHRIPRLLGWGDRNCYHILSRTTGQSFLFGPVEREQFARMLTKMAQFCGVEVLTWCCLSNHFHLLIRISASSTGKLKSCLSSDHARFVDHLKILYSKSEIAEIVAELEALRTTGGEEAADALVGRYLARIGVLPVFVKEFKQRFSIWYNYRNDRHGTLWSERFRSVLVEDSPRVLRTVACYIDLNPVRAGLVTDPKDYRWCGYGMAMGGCRSARAGLRAICSETGYGSEVHAPEGKWSELAASYRLSIFGRAATLDDGSGGILRRGASPEEVERVIANGGKLPAADLFHLRIRHFCRGTALGSKDFLEQMGEQRPQQVAEKRRKRECAHPIPALDVPDFFSFRDLKMRQPGNPAAPSGTNGE